VRTALEKLSVQQRRFVEGVANGMTLTDAYLAAGYAKKGARGNAARLKATDSVAAALREIQDASPAIATAQDLQEFWSRTMTDGDECMKNRLKASEYLAKAGALFTSNHNHNHRTTAEVIDALERAYEGPS
jgi:phage terminase small subunit